MNVYDAVNRWRRRLASEYAPTTVRTRCDQVLAVYSRAGLTEVGDLTEEHVRAHLEGLKTWSRRSYLTGLRQFFAHLGIADPTTDIRKPPSPKSTPNPVSEQQLARLVRNATPTARLAILLGAFAGLRVHEVAQVHAMDVLQDLDGRLQLRLTGKGEKFDLVPCPPVLARALARRLADHDGYLFPGRTASGHMHPRNLSSLVKAEAAALGIRMRFHQLRHRFGTAVYRARRDLLLTQKAMRHDNPQSTAGYALVADEDRYSVALELPGALEEGNADEPELQPAGV